MTSLPFINAECQINKEWETQQIFHAPESVVYDAKRNCLYVGSLNDKDGFIKTKDSLRNEYISKLDLDGNILKLKWLDCLRNTAGLTIFNDKLYIVERDGVSIANIEKAQIEQKILITDTGFLNDIVVDSDGTVYISDSFKSCIYRIKNGQSEVWYADSLMDSTNGILIDNNHLIVGNKGTENLLSISLTDKTAKVIADNLSVNIDGIKKYNNGYLLSWKSELYIFENGQKRVLLNLNDKNDFIADFEFIEKKNLIIIPLLMSNKVMALKIK